MILDSWFYDPIPDFAEESRRNGFAATVISHGNNNGAGIERTIGVCQAYTIFEFERQRGCEQHFLWRAEFDDGLFLQSPPASRRSGDSHWYADRRGGGKEFRQFLDAGRFCDSGNGLQFARHSELFFFPSVKAAQCLCIPL